MAVACYDKKFYCSKFERSLEMLTNNTCRCFCERIEYRPADKQAITSQDGDGDEEKGDDDTDKDRD